MYQPWSPSVQQLVYQSFQMPRVRKNLCNVVVVVDPTTPAGAEAMQILGMVVEQGLPVRVGLVLVSAKDVDGLDGNGDGLDGDHDGLDGDVLDGDGDGDLALDGGGGDSDAPPEAREIAELLSRLSEHGVRPAVLRFIRDVGSSLSRDRRPGGGGGGDGGNRFSRRDLADIFRRLAGGKGPLAESPSIAEPWTRAGAYFGSSSEGDGDD
ncbi:unnamed protein product, partial [Laminaria digitata]